MATAFAVAATGARVPARASPEDAGARFAAPQVPAIAAAVTTAMATRRVPRLTRLQPGAGRLLPACSVRLCFPGTMAREASMANPRSRISYENFTVRV